MPQAIVDPEELRQFARSLKKFNTELQERIGALQAQMANLAKTWWDQEHKKFVEQFEQHLKVLARFIDINEQHVPYLLRKAEYIDQYLQQS